MSADTRSSIVEHIKENSEYLHFRKDYLLKKYAHAFRSQYLRSKRHIQDTVEKAFLFLALWENAQENNESIETKAYLKMMLDDYIRTLAKYQTACYFRRLNKGKLTEDMIRKAKEYPVTDLISFNKNNMALCPFHSDKTPSLHYYKDTNTVHCFSCQKSWDSIDIVMELEGLNFIQAIKRLN